MAKGFTAWKRTAFSVLERDGSPYFENWEKSARYARRKSLEAIREGTMSVIETDVRTFREAYSASEIRHEFKESLLRALDFLPRRDPEMLRAYLSLNAEGRPTGGALFIDYAPTSLYYCAFLEKEGRRFEAGTALIDRWFSDSAERGFEYLDFGHLRSEEDPKDRDGYTNFKKRFAQYETLFDSVWWKWFP